MKLFVLFPEKYQEDISSLLTYASDNLENPDLRDRAFIYWRLLKINQNAAKNILFV